MRSRDAGVRHLIFMPDKIAVLNSLWMNSSYDNPDITHKGYRVFFDNDGFIPSAKNTLIVGKFLAYADTPTRRLQGATDRYFCSIVGGHAFEYYKGDDMSAEIEGCLTDKAFVFTQPNIVMRKLMMEAYDNMIKLLDESLV